MRPSRLDDRGKKTVKSDQKCNYVLYCWATGHTRFLSRVGVAPTDHELNRLSNSWPTTCLSLYSHTRIRTLRYLFGGLHLLFMRTCAPPYASKVFPLKKIKKTNNGEVTPVCVIRNLSPPNCFCFVLVSLTEEAEVETTKIKYLIRYINVKIIYLSGLAGIREPGPCIKLL